MKNRSKPEELLQSQNLRINYVIPLKKDGELDTERAISDLEEELKKRDEFQIANRQRIVVPRAYRIFRTYTILPSQNFWRIGNFGMSTNEIKIHLNFSRSVSQLTGELKTWRAFLKWCQNFDCAPIIEKWLEDHEVESRTQDGYDMKEERFIEDTIEHEDYVKEAIPFILKVIPVYKARIRKRKREIAEQKRLQTLEDEKKKLGKKKEKTKLNRLIKWRKKDEK